MVLCVLSVWVLSCRKHDVRIIVIHVPGMKNKGCAEIVQKAVIQEIGRAQAVPKDKHMVIDMAGRTVTVSYDSLKISGKNIEFAIAKAGFAANNVPGDPEAAKNLPDE